MAHGYRTLKHWDHWLAQPFLGPELLRAEGEMLLSLLNGHFGKHALLIGVPRQYSLLDKTKLSYHSLLTPLAGQHENHYTIESDLYELPILTGSIDLLILPHTLEFVDNPRQLLAEACRIIKPEGLIAISGFNPYSSWGIRKIWAKYRAKHPEIPWCANFIRPHKIKSWLRLADFAMENQTSTLFRPPINHLSSYTKFNFLEKLGRKCFPSYGGTYLLIARAKVIPLTPIKLKWKQQLSSIQISTTISGNIARQSDVTP